MASAYIAWYLFLAGAGSGSFAIGACVDLVLRRRQPPLLVRISPVTDAGLVAGPLLVALSGVFLVLDLGVPERAASVFLAAPTSLLGYGAWSIVLFVACAAGALAVGNLFDSVISRRVELVLHGAATVLSLFIMAYAGAYLSLYRTVPFLNTPLVPVLFVVSALTCGMAALIVIGFLRQNNDDVRAGLDGLIVADMALVVVEVVALVAFLLRAITVGEAAELSAEALLTGWLSGPFWLGVAMVGLGVPFVIDAACCRWPNAGLLVAGAGCTLAGGLALRYVVLLAALRFCLVDMAVVPYWT